MAYMRIIRYCDSRIYRDRRIMDYNYIRRVKHNDGFREIAQAIKKKGKDLLNYLKKIGVKGVLIRLIVAAITAAGAIFAAKKGVDAIKHCKTLKTVANNIDTEIRVEKEIFKAAGPVGYAAMKLAEGFKDLSKTLAETAGEQILKKEEEAGPVVQRVPVEKPKKPESIDPGFHIPRMAG